MVGAACKGEGYTGTSLSIAELGVWDRELGPGRSIKTSSQPTAQGINVAMLTPGLAMSGSWSTGQVRHRSREFQGSPTSLGSPSLS